MAYEIRPLEMIAETLEEEGYPSHYLQADELRPVDLLLVSLCPETEEAVILELSYVNDLALVMGVPEEYDDTVVLQFMVRFAFSFLPEAAGELARYFMSANRVAPVGHYGLSEPEGVIYFQYPLHLRTREVDYEVLLTVVSSVELFVAATLPMIEEIATGSLSAADAVERMAGSGFAVVPLLPGPASLLGPEEGEGEEEAKG